MFDLQNTINSLLKVMDSVPANTDVWNKKAAILCNFAESVAKQVLDKAGFKGAFDQRSANMIAKEIDPDDEAPSDCFSSLWLLSIKSDLTELTDADPPVMHEFVFGTERVLLYNTKTKKLESVMTYEEAARFVILWLLEKLLQIMRENRWDRIEQLPDLFDRLASFVTE